MKNYLPILTLLLLFSSSCKKNNSLLQISEGNYSGILQVTSSTYQIPVTYPIAILFEKGKYKISPDPARPGGGSGIYNVNGDIGHFEDQNFWTADFDWSLILSGEYQIQTDGDNLVLIKQLRSNIPAGTSYKYLLKKTN